MADAPFDVPRAHRWFAVELNNAAWDLVEAKQRTPEQVERMIHAAHGACFHWLHAGDELNHLRAQNLLATAYAAAGLGEAAIRHAERCLQLSAAVGDRQSAFDRAAVHGCAANAYKLAGRMDDAQGQHALARASAAKLDADDRKVIDLLYPLP